MSMAKVVKGDTAKEYPMMQDWPLLSLTTFLPLEGAGFILIILGEAEVVARPASWSPSLSCRPAWWR